MIEIELEKTYLVKKIPKGLSKSPKKEVYDLYVPVDAKHPTLRVRKNGEKYEITKKVPVENQDKSHKEEHTIKISKEEFKSFLKIKCKKLRKIRYYYDYEGRVAEIAIFKDNLRGLVLVDFEFKSKEEMSSFGMPEFCLAEVTHNEFFAGGMLCGKKYKDLIPHLKKYGYRRILIK